MRTLNVLLLPVALLFAVSCGNDNTLHDRTDTQPDPDDDTGVPIGDGPHPDIKVDPETLGFGFRPPNCASDAKTVTISNVGEAPLDLRSITLVGGGYAFANPSAVTNAPDLQPLESFAFEVKFTPTSMGPHDAAIEIRSNDPDENLVEVELVGEGSSNQMEEDIFTQAQPSAVDVLWVIDNSCSMENIIRDVGNNLGRMTENFVLLGLDYQLGVVTTDMELATDQGRLRGDRVFSVANQGSHQGVIDAFKLALPPDAGGSADERGRDAAYAALTNPLLSGHNAGFVRPSANLAVIVVSDEDDSSNNVSESTFISWLDAYKGDPDKTSFSGMVGPRTGGSLFSGCGITATPKYNNVIDATGGLHTDLCGQRFDEVLTWLSYYAAGMRAEFPLSRTPANQFQIQVKTEGRSIPFFNPSPSAGQTGSWELIFATNTIRLRGDAIPGPGQTVVVTYPVPNTCN